MIRSMLLLSMLLQVACATIHNGNKAKEAKAGLVVSGSETEALSSKHFLPLDFTIENQTDSWVHIDSVKLILGDQETRSKLSVPMGRDLQSWAEAAKQNAEIDTANTQMILGAIAAASAVAVSTSNQRAQTEIAALGLTAGAGGMAIDQFNNHLNSIQQAKILPESHLMSGPIAVPPGLHVKRWITVYAKDPMELPYLGIAVLIFKIKDGKEVFFEVPFRRLQSKFQKGHAGNKKKKKDKSDW